MAPMSDPPTDLAPRPVLDADRAARIAEACFGVRADEVVELSSERDRNFRLSVQDAPRYVLKVAGPEESRSLLEAQDAAMLHLARRLDDLAVPVPRPSRDGGFIAEAEDSAGERRLVRLLTWLPGTPLAGTGHDRDDPALARSLAAPPSRAPSAGTWPARLRSSRATATRCRRPIAASCSTAGWAACRPPSRCFLRSRAASSTTTRTTATSSPGTRGSADSSTSATWSRRSGSPRLPWPSPMRCSTRGIRP